MTYPKTSRLVALYWLLLSLVVGSCQQKKNTDSPPSPEPDVAVPTKRAYPAGDSVTIRLSQPLTELAIGWDTQRLASPARVDSLVSFKPTSETLGWHQLVVSGLTAARQPVSDTLWVELWSDVKPQRLAYSVLQTYPHQSSSFTQGLVFYQGGLYEGTGLNGQSKLMKVDLSSGRPLQTIPLPDQYFGEGITIVNDRIYQLTWTSGQCFRYRMDFALDTSFVYHTQGWGLTHRDTTLIVSDGSNRLSFYSPTFRKTGELVVYDDQGPVKNLNELEYVNGYVLANVWQTNRIVQINLASGKVVGELLIDPALPAGTDTKENVLNGIAYRPGENALYITGKNWPSLFKLQVRQLFRPASTTRAL